MAEIEKVETTAAFQALREEWNELLESSEAKGFFLTWEWLYCWWRNLAGKRKLHILTLRCGGRLAAIVPLALRPPGLAQGVPFRLLEFLGAGIAGSDYLDLIVRRGQEGEVRNALGPYLFRERRMLQFAQLKGNSSFARSLAGWLEEQKWGVSEVETNVCPVVNLRGHTWESYLSSLGSEHRYNFRRKLRKVAAEFEVRFDQVASDEERREALATLVALHRKRWRERGGSEAFQTPEFVAFHEELSRLALERGWLRLYVLRLDEKPAAALYGFRYGQVFYFYQAGFDPDYARSSAGLIVMGLAIRAALEEGVEVYDLLHGAEAYKFHWANETRPLARVDLYPPRALGYVSRRTVEAVRSARRWARRVLPETWVRRIVRATETA